MQLLRAKRITGKIVNICIKDNGNSDDFIKNSFLAYQFPTLTQFLANYKARQRNQSS